MDILVEWEDKSLNVVSSNQLLPVTSGQKFCKGVKVKMIYGGSWFYGQVLDTEAISSSESDNEPLSKYTKTVSSRIDSDEEPLSKYLASKVQNVAPDDVQTNNQDSFVEQTCEVISCQADVFSSCFRCSALLCFYHFENDDISCLSHNNESVDSSIIITYAVEGAEREYSRPRQKPKNHSKLAKALRNEGKEYYSTRTRKLVPARRLLDRCESAQCEKFGKKCGAFSDKKREEIFQSFYGLRDLQLRREFVVRHCEPVEIKQRTTKTVSRRSKSYRYLLSLDGNRVKVCKKFFINTLSISDKFLRTSLSKITKTGAVEKDRRGGRYKSLSDKDNELRRLVAEHINKFPKMESHYCRENSSRQYLYPDLTLRKMYELYLDESKKHKDIASMSTYVRVFREMNLSFHSPKKDQCSLCLTYRSGEKETKLALEEKYKKHTAEKIRVREIKQTCKNSATATGSENICAVFDLQQVIYLPILNDSKVFFKNRLINFNLTIYNLGTKDCYCYTWHEGISKRGANEISTCVYKFLLQCDTQGVKTVSLFADGCPAQNKNSVMAAMLLHLINNSSNISEISLRFFESYHGQNEGDSAHSAISFALKKAGEVCVPSQLPPIFRLARRRQPYIVTQMNYKQFLDFKGVAKNLRILTIRKDNESQNPINWTEIMELKVTKESPDTIYFKTSHLQSTYRSITLKRSASRFGPIGNAVSSLNKSPNKISSVKYTDLVTLCEGQTPPIKDREHAAFFRNLHYD
nr:unnamed protein product [Callosobruchus chinensis]